MRLESIKLAGFKSFVDPITVNFPSNLSGIVGPNGCGKSNVIDAVRWVMGESSAKHLRGESIVDVIFNGSVNRGPAGHAAIELHFDNSDGRLGGAYQQYAEIVVRRQVNLEGHSTYYLNGAVCRRRDITDVFLGTGLGPRSYAIIEQGTISRLIEAKPQDLRVYIEEAAGISKYRERRRETELRLGHTRDNLTRLNDIREELQKQLSHLTKQAEVAEKYQSLKLEEKKLRSEIFALRAKSLQTEIIDLQKLILETENILEKLNAENQALASAREIKQEECHESHGVLEDIQKNYYETNTALARLEQQIEHHRQQKKQLEENLNAVTEELSNATRQQADEVNAGEEFTAAYEKLHPEWEQSKTLLECAKEKLNEFELTFQEAQRNWDVFHQSSAHNLQRSQVEQTKIQHIEKQCQHIEERIKKLSEEEVQTHQLSLNFDLTPLQEKLLLTENEINSYQLSLTQNQQSLSVERGKGKEIQEALDTARTELQALKGRHASLMALQEAALGKNIESHQQFLKECGIENNARLAEKLNVQSGWETAVETVLFQQLESICIENFDDLVHHIASKINDLQFTLNLFNLLPSAQEGDVNLSTLSERKTLASVCDAPLAFQSLLSSVYLADSLNDALSQWHFLTKNLHCSVITREGFWLGNNFLIAFKSPTHAAKGNVILREKDLSQLSTQIQEKAQAVQQSQDSLVHHQAELRRLENICAENQSEISTLKAREADLNTQLKVQESQKAHQESRKEKLAQEIVELNTQLAHENTALEEARKAWQIALEALEKDSALREQLEKIREEKREFLKAAREDAQKQQQLTHSISTQLQVLETQRNANLALSERLSQQIQLLQQKKSDLSIALENLLPLESEYQQKLEVYLADKSVIEKQLQEKRAALSQLENQLREFEQEIKTLEEKQLNCRQLLEQKRLNLESASSTINSLKEQCASMDEVLENLLEKNLEGATQPGHEEALQKVCARIERLGLINLAAIAERESVLERKNYLDSQHQDLTTALELLEEAIRKIDKETRARFKETHEKVNGLFQELFPSIFGGGQASLELTGDDLLETGLQVMARPPGKRNSTIHLLSGGEKALTAIALVFSIFQLNPAPFCMLDEVDAPLDDTNIGRFCNLVKKMSEKVQFIFISHNKIAIEMAEHLIGVTMNEPGVSRCVSVDVKAAVEMAES